MTAKKLSIVPTQPPPNPAPPRALGAHGMALWRSVTSEYDVADAGGIEMLTAACQSLDRAERCREQIDADGEVIRTKTGIRDHPLLKHEVAARSFTVKAIRYLGLDVEALRPGPGRPPGPR